ncbi:MAG: FapA family protein [Bacillota bacterium]
MSARESVQSPVAPPPQDGRVTLTVSSNRMEAKASIVAPLHGGAAVTMEHVVAALASAKVTFGVDMEAVLELVRAGEELADGLEGSPAVIARGQAPVPGEDGAILHHELLQTPSGYPRIRDDGTADFFELNMVRNVQEGVVLATRKPPTRGQPGSDVHGRALPAPDGRDVKLRAGKGAKLSADGQSVLSAIEGHASVNHQGEIIVSPIFSVDGDLDWSTGSIDFVGTVIVRGDVGPGFSVKAGQNVEIHGGVVGGTVEAGGDLVVRYGIIGAGRGKVSAGGKVQCRFVEGAEIRAGGDVLVVEGLLNAHLFSGGKVAVTGPRGSIIGGQVRARDEVSAKVLGSSAGAPTEIQVGVPPEVRAEWEQVRRGLHQVEERLNRAVQTLIFLREMEQNRAGAVSSAHRQALQQAIRTQNQCRAEREQLLFRLEELQALFEHGKFGQIRAFEVAYPGVRIVIGSERYLVMDLCHRCCFFLSGEGLVEMAPA